MANLNDPLAATLTAPLANVTPTAAPGAPTPTTTTPSAPAPKAPVLPAEVQNNKVIKEVLQGSIPGVIVRPNLYYPKAYKIAESWEDLMAVGLDFFWTPDQSTILFNPAKISEEEIKKAINDGIINQILPDWETLSGERPQKPPKGVQVGFGGADTPPPTPMAPEAPGALPATNLRPVSGAGGDLSNKLANQRIRNVNVVNAGPTSGPVPGAGRILNAAATPAV